MAVGNLDIKLALDAASFSANMKKATGDIEKFTSSAEQIKNIAIGNFVSQVALGALQELGRVFAGVIDQAREWNAIGKKLGGGDELGAAIQGNAVALAELGVSFQTSSAGLERFGVAMQETIQKGLTPGKVGFETLGISVTTASGQFRPFNEVMLQTLDKLAAMPPSVERNTAAMRVFGRSLGGDVISKLDEFGESFRKAQEEASRNAVVWQKLGGAIDDMKAKASAAAVNGMTPLVDLLIKLAGAVAGAAPVLARLAGELINVATEGGNAESGLSRVKEGADTAVIGAAALVGEIAGLISMISSLIAMANAASAALASMMAVARSAGAATNAALRATAADFTGNTEEGDAQRRRLTDELGKVATETAKVSDEGAKLVDIYNNIEPKRLKAVEESHAASLAYLQKQNAEIAKALALNKGAPGAGGTRTPRGGGGGGKKKGGGRKGGKSDEEKSIETLQKFIEKTREAEGSVESFRLKMEENMAKAHEAMQKGLISPEEEARFRAFFEKEYQLKIAKATGIDNMTSILDDLQKGFESFGQSAAASLADAIVEGEDLEDTLKALLKQLVKMIIQIAILEPLMNSIFGKGGIGGILGGIVAPTAMATAMPLAPPARMASPLSGIGPASRSGIVRSSGAATANARRAVSGVTVKQDVGPMTINMDTGKVKATTEQGAALGEKIRASVQQILVQEQRAGGILSGRR